MNGADSVKYPNKCCIWLNLPHHFMLWILEGCLCRKNGSVSVSTTTGQVQFIIHSVNKFKHFCESLQIVRFYFCKNWFKYSTNIKGRLFCDFLFVEEMYCSTYTAVGLIKELNLRMSKWKWSFFYTFVNLVLIDPKGPICVLIKNKL